MPDESRCKSCGRRILWVKTPNARLMPIDPEPCEDGNLFLRDGVAVSVVVQDPAFNPRGELKYKPHFATCKFASQHRKGKRRAN